MDNRNQPKKKSISHSGTCTITIHIKLRKRSCFFCLLFLIHDWWTTQNTKDAPGWFYLSACTTERTAAKEKFRGCLMPGLSFLIFLTWFDFWRGWVRLVGKGLGHGFMRTTTSANGRMDGEYIAVQWIDEVDSQMRFHYWYAMMWCDWLAELLEAQH